MEQGRYWYGSGIVVLCLAGEREELREGKALPQNTDPIPLAIQESNDIHAAFFFGNHVEGKIVFHLNEADTPCLEHGIRLLYLI